MADEFGELGGEVLVAGTVLHVADDLAAELLVGLLEEVGEAHGVVADHVGEHGGLLEAESLVDVGRGGGALIGVDEAGAEVVLLALRHERVGAGGADDGHLGAFGDFAAGHGERGAVGADDGEHLVMFGETFHGVGGFDLVGLVVHDDQFDGAIQHGGFQLVGELDAFELQLSAEGVLSGQGQVDADFDGIGGLRRKGEAHAHDGHGDRAQKFAEFHVSILQKGFAPEAGPAGIFGCRTGSWRSGDRLILSIGKITFSQPEKPFSASTWDRRSFRFERSGAARSSCATRLSVNYVLFQKIRARGLRKRRAGSCRRTAPAVRRNVRRGWRSPEPWRAPEPARRPSDRASWSSRVVRR